MTDEHAKSLGKDHDNDSVVSSETKTNFEDVSDIEDPTYTPQRDKNCQKKNRIYDLFHVNPKNPIGPQSESQGSSSSSIIVASSFSGSSTSDIRVKSSTGIKETHERDSMLMLKAEKYPYLGGKFLKLIVINEEEKKVHGQCQLCLPKEVTIKGFLGVSTNFLKHLKKNHDKVLDDYNTYKHVKKSNLKRIHNDRSMDNNDDTTRSGSSTSTQPVIPNKQRKITEAFPKKRNIFLNQAAFDKRIVNFIVSTMSPISIVDNPAFVSLFDGMGVKVMHRTTAVNKIEDYVLENVTRIKNDLDQAFYVCTTADVWSAKHRSFFGVTAHWINANTENFERCSAALACRRFTGSHTYDRITEILEDIHLQFNLRNDKLVATISDNGSNFVKAFKEFGPSADVDNENNEDDEIQFLDLSNNILPKHVRCASHTLNLIATVDVKNVIQKNTTLRTRHTNAIAKCNVLWKMAGKPKTNEVIKQILGHTLSYPGPTRWNSLYDSIAQILKNKDKLQQLFEKLSVRDQMFKDAELKYLTEYCAILQPLANAIDILQGDQNTYFGYLLPCLGSLYKKLTRMGSDNNNSTRPILEACRDGLIKRFGAYFNFSTSEAKKATIASFTLPQFKLRWKTCFQSFIEDDLSESIATFILEKAQDMDLKDNIMEINEERKHPVVDEFFELDIDTEDEKQNKNINKKNLKKKIELEILQYLNDPSMEIESLHRHPLIKRLFYKYNTCLPSSAPVERLFSFAEIINSPRRHALSDRHFEELVILKSNSKKYNLL